MIFARKINEIPEFYIFAKIAEFYTIIAPKIFFPNLGCMCHPLPCAPSPKPMFLTHHDSLLFVDSTLYPVRNNISIQCCDGIDEPS